MVLVLSCDSVLFKVITAWLRTAYVLSVSVRINTVLRKVSKLKQPWGPVSEVVWKSWMSLKSNVSAASLGTAEPAPSQLSGRGRLSQMS